LKLQSGGWQQSGRSGLGLGDKGTREQSLMMEGYKCWKRLEELKVRSRNDAAHTVAEGINGST
jgi:hypothetical protein